MSVAGSSYRFTKEDFEIEWRNSLFIDRNNKALGIYDFLKEIKYPELIISKDIKENSGSKLHIIDEFKNLKKMIRRTNPGERHFYEYVQEHQPRKPYLDIDVKEEDIEDPEDRKEVFKTVFNYCIERIKKLGCVDIIILDGSYEKKESAHIIIDGFYQKNLDESKSFHKYIIDKLDDNFVKFIDNSVYSTKQQFRMLGCIKKGKKTPLTYKGMSFEESYEEIFEKTLITAVKDDFKHLELPLEYLPKKKVRMELINQGQVPNVKIDVMLEILARLDRNKYKDHQPRIDIIWRVADYYKGAEIGCEVIRKWYDTIVIEKTDKAYDRIADDYKIWKDAENSKKWAGIKSKLMKPSDYVKTLTGYSEENKNIMIEEEEKKRKELHEKVDRRKKESTTQTVIEENINTEWEVGRFGDITFSDFLKKYNKNKVYTFNEYDDFVKMMDELNNDLSKCIRWCPGTNTQVFINGNEGIFTMIMGNFIKDYCKKNITYSPAEGEIKQIGIFDTIFRNDTKLMVDKITYEPYSELEEDPCENKNQVNAFKGYGVKMDRTIDYEEAKKAFQSWYDLLYKLCENNDNFTDYVINIIANMFQNPRSRMHAKMIIITSKIKGVGKGMFFENLLSVLLGSNFISKEKISSLDKNFNKELMGKLLIYIGECRDDRKSNNKATDILKSLITDPRINIEPKRVDSFVISNYLHIFASSNYDYPVIFDKDERRYVVGNSTAKKMTTDEITKYLDLLNDSIHMSKVMSYFMLYPVDPNKMSYVSETKGWNKIVHDSLISRFLEDKCESLEETIFEIAARDLFKEFLTWAVEGNYKHNYNDRQFGKKVKEFFEIDGRSFVSNRKNIGGKKETMYNLSWKTFE